ncbi:MAG: hypothetical protein ACMXX6_02020 [Candidatus Woesearchaeota archaeon]
MNEKDENKEQRNEDMMKYGLRSVVAGLGFAEAGPIHYAALRLNDKFEKFNYKHISNFLISGSILLGIASGAISNSTTQNSMSNEHFHYEETVKERTSFPNAISIASNFAAEFIAPSKKTNKFFVSNENNTFCQYDLTERLKETSISTEFAESLPMIPNKVMNEYGKQISKNNTEFRQIANTCYNTVQEKIKEHNKLYEGSEKNPFHKNQRLMIR